MKKTFKTSSFYNNSNFHNGFVWNPSKVQMSLFERFPLTFWPRLFIFKIDLNVKPLLFLLIRTMVYRIKLLIEKNCFCCRMCKNYWITYCTRNVMPHAIWVAEIADEIISLKKSIKIKENWKNSFLNKFYIIFHFLSLCVFISIQNIGRCIPLRRLVKSKKQEKRCNRKSND